MVLVFFPCAALEMTPCIWGSFWALSKHVVASQLSHGSYSFLICNFALCQLNWDLSSACHVYLGGWFVPSSSLNMNLFIKSSFQHFAPREPVLRRRAFARQLTCCSGDKQHSPLLFFRRKEILQFPSNEFSKAQWKERFPFCWGTLPLLPVSALKCLRPLLSPKQWPLVFPPA